MTQKLLAVNMSISVHPEEVLIQISAIDLIWKEKH